MSKTTHRPSDVTYRVSEEQSISDGVVQAVASVADVDPIPDPAGDAGETLEPLYTAIDPDALDALFEQSDDGTEPSEVSVVFPYHGYRVTVRGDGTILVEPSD